jgi:hypothetical protein
MAKPLAVAKAEYGKKTPFVHKKPLRANTVGLPYSRDFRFLQAIIWSTLLSFGKPSSGEIPS